MPLNLSSKTLQSSFFSWREGQPALFSKTLAKEKAENITFQVHVPNKEYKIHSGLKITASEWTIPASMTICLDKLSIC